jgi:hypothetical protein
MTDVGYLGAASNGRPVYLDSGGSVFDLIHSGNVGSYNAGSATKLQTARTIWGQSFDGTENIDGQLDINGLGTLHRDDSALWLNYGGANNNQSLRVCGYDIAFYYGIGSNFTRAITITSDGNIAFGGTTADAKLHVHGNGLFDNTLSDTAWVSDTGQLIIRSTSTNYHLGFGVASNGLAAIQGGNRGVGAISLLLNPNGGNVAVGGTTASAKFHVHGDILATGAITMFSQLSMKNVIDYDGLSLAQLAQIRPARFTWKDRRDNRIHVGGIADYIRPILPEVVYETVNKELTVDYGSAAFYIGASLIKPVVELWEVKDKQQEEIESLKKRVEYLENENRQLRAS